MVRRPCRMKRALVTTTNTVDTLLFTTPMARPHFWTWKQSKGLVINCRPCLPPPARWTRSCLQRPWLTLTSGHGNKVRDWSLIDSVPHVVEVARHHSNAQTNKPTKCDGRVAPLIFPLHNADKASADPPIGLNFMTNFLF